MPQVLWSGAVIVGRSGGMKITLLSLLGLVACGPAVYATRVGGLYAALDGGKCEVVFENIEAPVAMAQHKHIGMITFQGSGATTFNEELKGRVREEACKLGGNLVTFNASTDMSIASNSQFLVFIKQAKAEEKPAEATQL
jgi:hypothetical protein